MIVQRNGLYSNSNIFILLFKTQFIASKFYLYIPESLTLLTCQSNVFRPCVAILLFFSYFVCLIRFMYPALTFSDFILSVYIDVQINPDLDLGQKLHKLLKYITFK